MEKKIPAGKLPAALLQAFLEKYAVLDERVVVGPKVGEDAAVLAMGDRYLVVTSDPITFVTEDVGWYVLVVNSNDLAVRGARPQWFLATLLLPEGQTTEASAEAVFSQLGQACRALGVSLVGGHTEITHGVDRPIVVGTMMGEVAPDKLVTTGGAQVGDVLLLTKGIPIEGTSIIARIKAQELRARGFTETFLDRARGFLHRPGISVLPEALLATELTKVHAMHDPTEGGLAGGLWELAQASGVGLRIDAERIPILPEGERLCREFGLDPLGTIASGALLLALAPSEAATMLHACARDGIDCAFIGHVVPAAEGMALQNKGKVEPLPTFGRDEITKLFG